MRYMLHLSLSLHVELSILFEGLPRSLAQHQEGMILAHAAATEGDIHNGGIAVLPDSLRHIAVRNPLSFQGLGDQLPLSMTAVGSMG